METLEAEKVVKEEAKEEVKTEAKAQGKQAKAGTSAQPIPTYFGNKKFVIRYKKKTWMLVIGILLLIGATGDFIEDIVKVFGGGQMSLISEMVEGAAMLIAGIALIIYSTNYERKYGRYVQIINVMMGQIPIANIAAQYPTTYDQAEKDLQEMINKKILYGAYIDYRNGMLVLNPKNPNVEAPMDGTANPKNEEKKETQGGVFDKRNWVDLEKAASGIKDPDINLRVSRINSTLSSIRDKAKGRKEIESNNDVKKFMEFYVPKIRNLLGQYAELEGVSDDITESRLKKDLMDTLESLDAASMNLWNEMVSSDVVNISTELDALNKKLVIDGLSDSDFDVKGGNDGK